MSDYKKVVKLIRSGGYVVNIPIDGDGVEIFDGTHTVGAVIKAAPDCDIDGKPMTDFFTFCGDNDSDGHLYLFREGYPERNEVLRAVSLAFADEREWRGAKCG